MSDDKYYVDPDWCSECPDNAAAELARLHKWCDETERERDAALEREQALAAHVDQLTTYVDDAHDTFVNISEYWNGGEGLAAEDAARHAQDDACDMLDLKPDTKTDTYALAKRDLIKQAEELDEVAAQIGILKPGQVSPVSIAVSLRMRAKDKRQQAEALNADT